MDFIHYIFPGMSFAWFPPHIWCTASHCFSFAYDSWWTSLLLVHVLLVLFWTSLCPWDQQYPLGYIFDSYFFLVTSVFYWVVCPIFPVPCWSRLAVVTFRSLLDYVKVLLEAINWSTTSLSEKSASSRFSSTEGKYSCSSASWLTFWNTACVSFKCCYYLNSLYSNAKKLKPAHVLFCAQLPTPVFASICVYSRRDYSMICHL